MGHVCISYDLVSLRIINSSHSQWGFETFIGILVPLSCWLIWFLVIMFWQADIWYFCSSYIYWCGQITCRGDWNELGLLGITWRICIIICNLKVIEDWFPHHRKWVGRSCQYWTKLLVWSLCYSGLCTIWALSNTCVFISWWWSLCGFMNTMMIIFILIVYWRQNWFWLVFIL